MKKMGKYIIVGLVPMLIFFIAASLNKFMPIGKMMFNIYDSSVQYAGIFEEIKNFSFFSWHGGLGFNLFGTATYYLFSPLNIIYLFFKMVDFPIFYAIIIYLKIGIASIFMYIFLKNENKKENIWQMILAIVYSLCGFMSTYYYNTLWMDGFCLLPLVLLGLNKLIREDKKGFYLVSLTLTILINYYIGYMICIFSVIYFIYKAIDENKLKARIKSFLITSILAGLIAAVVILPSLFALLQGKSSVYATDFTNYWQINENIKSFFYNLTPASYQLGDQSYGPALIYSSLLVIIAMILFFFNEKITRKTKIVVLSIIAFYFIGFSFNLFDFAWQFFQKPVWWQSRYSFTFSAFMIIIAYNSLSNIEGLKISVKQKSIVAMIFTILVVISAFLVIKDTLFYKSLAIVFLLVSLFFIFDYFLLINHKNLKWFIIVLVIIELFMNTFNSLKKNSTTTEFSFTKKVREIREEAVLNTKEYDDSFYRMEFVYKHTSNDGMLFNYNGITTFNSVRNQKFINLAEYYLNINVDSNCGIYFDYFNPYLMSLFNVKYILDYEHSYYKKVIENSSYSTFLNQYPLAIGFIVNEDILDVKLEENNHISNINKIFGAMIGEEIDTYVDVVGKFKPEKDLLFVKKDNPNINEIFIEGVRKEASVSSDLLEEGVNYTINSSAKVIDLDVYNRVMDILSENLLIVEDVPNKVLKGKIEAKENQLLFLSIPQDEGFVIKVNGKKVEPKLILDTFMAIELKEGNNEIEIDYIPQGLIAGGIISGVSIFLSILYVYSKKKKAQI